MLIQKAEERDLDALLDLYDRLYEILTDEYGYPFTLSREDNREVLSVQIKSRLCLILVALEGERPIGFVHASVSKLDRRLSYKGEKAIGRIDDIYVDDAERGTGTAQALIKAAEEWFREGEISFVESYILRENGRSMRFHEKCGFSNISSRFCKKL